MKICIINSLYEPYGRGGAEIIVKKQICNFLKNDAAVLLLASRPLFCRRKKREMELRTDNDRLKIIRFFPLNIFSFYHIQKFPFWVRALWRCFDIFNLHSLAFIYLVLKKEKPDLVYTHNLTGIGYLIPWLIKKMKIKNIHTLHDVALIRPSGLLICGQEKITLFNSFYVTLTRRLFGSPDQVNYPSLWLKNFYDQYGFFSHSLKKIIPNDSVNKKNLITGQFFKKQNRVNLLYLGQLEKHKGILFLIDALNNFTDFDYRLAVVGSGSQLKQARFLAGKNHKIFFAGWQPSHKINSFFRETDYTLVPSLCYENSPTVIFESLRADVPVIASNLGGIPELIKNGLNGYLFTAGNKNDFLNILKNAIIKKIILPAQGQIFI